MILDDRAIMTSRRVTKILNVSLMIVTFMLAFTYSLRRMSDTDLWGHLKCGEYLFEKGEILKTHYFNCSWTDYPYLNHEWLFQAIIYRIHEYTGELGLITVQVMLILLSFLILFRIMRLYTKNIFLIVLVMSLGIIASSHRFILRPQHFSYVFLLYFLFALHIYQRGDRRYIYYLPLVMIAWVNIHAESLWGILVPGAFIVGEYVKKLLKREYKSDLKTLLIVYGIVLLASMINPFTYKTIIWPLIVMKEQFAGVEELLAPTTIRYLFFWIYFLIFVLSSMMNIRRIDTTWLLLSIIFAFIAWAANRGIPHFIFASAPFIVANFNGIIKEIRFRQIYNSLLKIIFLVLTLYVIVSVVSHPSYLKKYDNYKYPLGALNFLKNSNVKGNVFNHHPWGSFIIWTSYPHLRPYIDGRYFFRKFYDEYYQILSGGDGWKEILYKYDISIALLPYSIGDQATLNDSLYFDADWYLVYRDDTSLLYLKDTAANRPVINEHGNKYLNLDRQLNR